MQTDSATPGYTEDWGSVGPQTDGTTIVPDVATVVTPNDAGGGPPATYGNTILDVFKYGVGVWQADKTQTRLIDYKKFEATNTGVYQNGVPAIFRTNASGGGTSPVLYAFGAVLLLGIVVMAVRK